MLALVVGTEWHNYWHSYCCCTRRTDLGTRVGNCLGSGDTRSGNCIVVVVVVGTVPVGIAIAVVAPVGIADPGLGIAVAVVPDHKTHWHFDCNIHWDHNSAHLQIHPNGIHCYPCTVHHCTIHSHRRHNARRVQWDSEVLRNGGEVLRSDDHPRSDAGDPRNVHGGHGGGGRPLVGDPRACAGGSAC